MCQRSAGKKRNECRRRKIPTVKNIWKLKDGIRI
jgi:hypothetical protein